MDIYYAGTENVRHLRGVIKAVKKTREDSNVYCLISYANLGSSVDSKVKRMEECVDVIKKGE